MSTANAIRTYLISDSIVDLYYTQIIGDPTNRPVIKTSASFNNQSFALIDSNPYLFSGTLSYNSTNVFFRQIRNIVLDTTALPPQFPAIGIHWPSSQATSISSCEFRLSTIPGNRHTGLFIEEGSGGLLNDLYFYGGGNATVLGNQQFTARNIWFVGADVAIWMPWDWGWTFKSVVFKNCRVGIKMDPASYSVGSITMLDSWFENIDIAIATTRNHSQAISGAASLAFENVKFQNVKSVLLDTEGVDHARSALEPGEDSVFIMVGLPSRNVKTTNKFRDTMLIRRTTSMQLHSTRSHYLGVKSFSIVISTTSDLSHSMKMFRAKTSFHPRRAEHTEMHHMMIHKYLTTCSSTQQKITSSHILTLDTTWLRIPSTSLRMLR